MVALYDRIGVSYTATRRPDPRISAQISAALRDQQSVINVGAGAGAYEPPQTILAVEPSGVMIGHRAAGSAPAVRGVAEALPVADGAADAVMAVLTVHHWSSLAAGVAELRRVARRRIIVLAPDPGLGEEFWLTRDYLPAVGAADASQLIAADTLAAMLGGARIEPVPVPHDCADGIAAAYWRRPAAYLDPAVQAGISLLARADPGVLRAGLARLAADLRSGRWQERNAGLLGRPEFDGGLRLLIADR
ncbi:MAG TPA: methyltransferase domain-containing protein [Streptosporangiaceae bacterium]|jgi:SAM-dependent methyltransferase